MGNEEANTFEDVGHLFLEVVDLERREEAEAAHVKGHHRRHGLLRRNQV